MLPRALVALGLLSLVAGASLIGQREAVPAYAATITVDTTADEMAVDGNCSLREAIQAANTHTTVDACGGASSANTVVVPAGTYTLTISHFFDPDDNLVGDLNVTSDVTLVGAGADQTIVQACDSSGGPCTGIDRLLHIQSGTTVTVSGVTLRNGHPGGFGGAIFNSGTLTVADSAITRNSSGHGGGIYNDVSASLTVTDSVVAENSVGDPGSGGGLYNQYSATMVVTRTTIAGNSSWNGGGGIANEGAYNHENTLVVDQSTISGNAGAFGGGVDNGRYSRATIINTTINGNSATSAYLGYGGGVANDGGALAVDFSTVTGNSAIKGGGGVYLFSTFAHTTLKNTIVADQASSGDCGGDPVVSGGHNLASDSTCAFSGSGDLINTDPMVGPLANNGGPTETQALLPGSPAIDAVSLANCTNALGDPVPTDQRGVARPQGPACDVGAFEAPFAPPSTATPAPTRTPTVVPIRVGGIADVHVGPDPAGAAGTKGPEPRVAYFLTIIAALPALAIVGWCVRRRRRA